MNEAHDTANQSRPGLLLSRATLLVMAAMLALSMAASPALGQSGWSESTTGDGGSSERSGADSKEEPGEEPSYTEDELQMVEEINAYRQEQGLSPLEVSDEASRAASNHSSDMATYDFFGHDTKESDTYEPGADFSERMDEAGYDYETTRSENVAAGNSEAGPTFEQWRTSPGHNENMLREDMEVVGIGKACSEDSTHGCYWTTDFGAYTPDDARPVAEIEPSQNGGGGGSSGGDSSDSDPSTGSSDDSSSTTDVEQSMDEDSASSEDTSSEDGSSEDTSGSNQGNAEPRVEVVEQQNSGDEGSSDSGWGGESSGDATSSGDGNSGDGDSGQSQKAVQITQNGETTTLTGDEANEEICKQFGQTREEVISALREDTGSSSGSAGGSSGSSDEWSTDSESGSGSEGSSSEDQAAAIKNDIADDFEESLLNPESCQGGGEQSSDSAEGTTGESDSGEDASSEDTSSDDASSDQYANGEDASGEDTSGEDSSSEDTSGEDASEENSSNGDASDEDASNEDTDAGSDQYASEDSDQETSSEDASEGSEASDENSAMEDTSMADEASGGSSSGDNTSGESTSEESTSEENTSEESDSWDSSEGDEDDESDAGDEGSGISQMLIFWK